MPYAFHYDVPADERVRGEIGDEKPQGLVAHLVVKRERGLRHIEVWDSKDDWERFRVGRIDPALEKAFAASGIAHRSPQPPAHDLELVDAWVGA